MRKRSLAAAAAGATGVAALAAYVFVVRPWHMRWGATDEETREALPGDELVPDASESVTHALTINAPVWAVWPWLAQMGQNKGGFYSYSWLENLVGCQMRNADRIVPEFQHLKAGDRVWLHPKVPPLPVLVCEPYKALMLGSNTDEPGTWGFFLKPLGDDDKTRLVVRGRGRVARGPLGWLVHHALFEPTHFVMERKMMLEIKRLAEASARAAADEPLLRGLNMSWDFPKLDAEEARPMRG